MSSAGRKGSKSAERLATGSSSRLQTGSSTTTSSSRLNTGAAPLTPLLPVLLPPIVEAQSHSYTAGYNPLAGGPDDIKPLGKKRTNEQTAAKLGYYGEYKTGETPAGRLLGSYGYTSPSYGKDIMPAPRATRGNGTTAGVALRPIRGGRSVLTEQDIEFLKERDKDNQQVFEVWQQRKALEQQLAQEHIEQRKASSEQRFEQRMQELERANEEALKQWTQRKMAQQQADAEENYIKQIQMRALQAYRHRMQKEYEARCRKLEQGFSSSPAGTLAQQLHDARHPTRPLRGEGSKTGGKGAPQKERSDTSYKGLLAELDRHAADDAALLASLAAAGHVPHMGLHTLGSRDGSSSPSARAGGKGAPNRSVSNSSEALMAAVSAEPSFASVARHNAAAGRSGSPTSTASPKLSSHGQQQPHHLPALVHPHGALASYEPVRAGSGSGSAAEAEAAAAAGHAHLPPHIASAYASKQALEALPVEGAAAAGAAGPASAPAGGPGPGEEPRAAASRSASASSSRAAPAAASSSPASAAGSRGASRNASMASRGSGSGADAEAQDAAAPAGEALAASASFELRPPSVSAAQDAAGGDTAGSGPGSAAAGAAATVPGSRGGSGTASPARPASARPPSGARAASAVSSGVGGTSAVLRNASIGSSVGSAAAAAAALDTSGAPLPEGAERPVSAAAAQPDEAGAAQSGEFAGLQAPASGGSRSGTPVALSGEAPTFSSATPPEMMPPCGLDGTAPVSKSGSVRHQPSSALPEASIAGSVPGMGGDGEGQGEDGMDGMGVGGEADDDDDDGGEIDLPRWDDGDDPEEAEMAELQAAMAAAASTGLGD